MGYYANGNGHITLKEDIAEEKIEFVTDTLSDVFCLCGDSYVIEGEVVVDFYHPDEKYYEDEVTDCLGRITPYITEGSVDFSGEDETYWSFSFNSDRENWDYYEGEVLFDNQKLYVLIVNGKAHKVFRCFNDAGMYLIELKKGDDFKAEIQEVSLYL